MNRKDARIWPGYVMVGEVTSPFGIDGSVRVYATTDFPERLVTLTQVAVDLLGETCGVVSSRLASPSLAVMKLAGFTTREQAARLRGAVLMVPTSELPTLAPDEYYWHQLLGLTVVEADSGRVLGELAHVLRTGASHDVFEVTREGKKPLLIPALKSVVLEVDLRQARMLVRLLPGLEEIGE
ncbi:MAG: 16S rRNA processing protein RimM [Sulfobacillus acidophilus]|uniref:Ribosome maturation factor RimM n=1 Tax=Sulfobacillus acidophilus TaxID=53633 RepID=A0A2T2WHZ4_9FIRM|nr:MAG: 16S rRNA processing protein RimM [Sulfobacillus acidophilus]